MQPPDGELVLAQIDGDVPHADVGILHAQFLIDRRVGDDLKAHLAQDQLGLVTEGPAAEQPTEVFLPRAQLLFERLSLRLQIDVLLIQALQRLVRHVALCQGRRKIGGFFQRLRRDAACVLDRLRIAA